MKTSPTSFASPWLLAAALAACFTASAADAPKTPVNSTIALLDTDSDGTVDLAEAQKAAEAKFAMLDVDKDGTLDAKELSKVAVSNKAFAAADPDHDKTLDKAEYLNLVATRFQAADKDHDGTLSAAEFQTRAGRALLALIK
jgi:Ca2+-binding EF-hand superfamily protein